MLAEHAERDRVLDLEPVAEVGEVLAAQQAAAARPRRARRCGATSSPSSTRPAPTRGSSSAPARAPGLMLFRAAKALAALEGRDHALPDDVQALAPGGAHAPAAAGARRGRERARAASSATRWTASPRCEAGVMRALGTAAARGRALPGGARPSTPPRCTSPASRCCVLAARRASRGSRWPRAGARVTRAPGPARRSWRSEP